MKKPIITKSRYTGLCFGLRRAHRMVFKLKHPAPVYIIGSLAHNKEIVFLAHKRGLRKINKRTNLSGGTVIFAPHGACPEDYDWFDQKQIKIVDATCPQVMKVQQIAKNYSSQGRTIIIFGDKNHTEVKNICAWAKNRVMVLDSPKKIDDIKFDNKAGYCLVAQTTKSEKDYKHISSLLKKRLGKGMVSCQTICPAVKARQDEAVNLARENDLVIVVGGKKSSNSKEIYKIAKSINKNSYFIENEKKIKRLWFKESTKVAILSGTSTPSETVNRVINRIEKNLNDSLPKR